MTDQPETTPDEGNDGRIPRLAIAVAVFGVVASLAIYGLSFVPGSGSVAINWDTIEPVKSPSAKKVGKGSFAVARTSISALAPNQDGLLLYRVAGVIRVDSGGNQPATIRCDVFSRPEGDGDTQIARSTKLRAAWPKPSDKLQAQAMPDTSLVKFDTGGNSKIDLPIKDVGQRYTDSDAKTIVEWPGYVEEEQTWVWTMENGTGIGTATMPWLVIFEAENRPRALIDCKADLGRKSTRVRIPVRQTEWPIADDQPNTGSDAETGDVPDVQ